LPGAAPEQLARIKKYIVKVDRALSGAPHTCWDKT
jgi:hypothetical protein